MDYKRIVIKIGSSLLYSEKTRFDADLMADLTAGISALIKAGKEVVLVSSGAIAMGMAVLHNRSFCV
jgi:glutamate 5-kinase